MDDNPFLPPEADGAAVNAGDGAYYAQGELLVIAKDGPPLPDRCVKCNAPATERFERTLQWFPRWVILTILICWPVYLIAMLMTRQTAKVNVGLCGEHAGRRRTFAWIGGIILGSALVALFAGIFVEDLALMFGGIVAVIVGAIALQPSIVLRPTQIDEHLGYYKGASEEFLRSL